MTRMLPKSSSQKTLRAAMQEERTTTMASRLLSTDASLSNSSFRVYYGVASAGSVPFLWESASGTPKNAISDTALPPLTRLAAGALCNGDAGGAVQMQSCRGGSKGAGNGAGARAPARTGGASATASKKKN